MIAFFALRATVRLGPTVQKNCGKSLARQWWEQLAIGVQYRILPRRYYMFELFRDDLRRRASHYISRFETKHALYRVIKRGTDLPPLQDKLLFTRHCSLHGIATIPILALFQNRTVEFLAGDRLPACDLFLKPTSGRGGRGAELWLASADGSYVNRSGQRLAPADLIARARALSIRSPLILQKRILNHPKLLPLSPSALATMRILTFTNEHNDIEVVRAVFRMGRTAESVVDNFHSGGIATKIELETGDLGSATDIGLKNSIGWVDRHPATGARIAGYRLPIWREAQQLAIRAHQASHERMLIGWDIAWTPDRLVVVEGNAAPDISNIQRPHREPLGETRFGELLAWHLKQVLEPQHSIVGPQRETAIHLPHSIHPL
jgi:hypothetical protein